MSDRIPMTRAGYESLKARLEQLKTVERPQNVRDIEEALSHGDLSENAEYHAAKEKQSHIAGRIASTEDKLGRAQVIDPPSTPPEKVQFGVTVQLRDLENDETVHYRIVGEDEADPKRGMISVTSPLARAMMSRECNEEIIVKAPKGDREFEILEIDFE